ncbi:MAG: YggS family pyridoxal phosphate-dependent enzyme [Sphaerochaetaceae bacterium]|nr:YggS family pyridoxal phosphate-dependent enzyme [Sphaerochaetaceae bacterium]
MSDTCKERVEEVLAEIQAAAAACGRSVDDITLMGVSKTHPWDSVIEGYEAGLRLFGENRVQEVEAKFPRIPERPEGMKLHLIGHLQSNKVKKIVPLVDGIDSVDSLKLATLISECALSCGRVMPVLLEFNTSGEEAKSGFETETALFDMLDHAEGLKGINIRGLMTIGPLGGDERQVRGAFARLRKLFETCRVRYPSFDFAVLSMGMSGDFAWAVEEGSTVVRVGTRLFGARDYSK